MEYIWLSQTNQSKRQSQEISIKVKRVLNPFWKFYKSLLMFYHVEKEIFMHYIQKVDKK